jgi:flavodoxin
MKVGIIVFSQTGHTLSVALKVEGKLAEAGHAASIERIEVSGPVRPGATDLKLKTRPAADAYDALVFGAPVMAFSLSPAMASYLAQIASLEGRKVACLVTEFFPFPWMGGTRAISQMIEICESKGATICGSGVVNWSRLCRGRQITEVTDRLSKLF